MQYGITFVLISCCFLSYTFASRGNEQSIFLQCVDHCNQTQCPAQLPLPLTLLFWSCKENCQYNCMQTITDKALEHGEQVFQYFGKWPFYRWMGIQEPASVLFSIGNGWVHYHYYHILKKKIPSNYYLKNAMLVYALFGMNAWIWSTVFHARDTAITEKLDYFSAGLLILYSLYYALRRLFYIQHPPWWMTLVFVSCYGIHVGYLSLIRFDYGYNMLASVVVGLIQLSLWVGWSIQQYTVDDKRRSFAYMALISVVGVALAMSLELLDFPPLLRILDAHSLWHLSTIPLMAIWYQFVLKDTTHEMKYHKSTVTTTLPIPK
ncbi:Per1-like protein [Halteromyces radiatus]|uniref:Per1-like protein n=1 Tax=Halteromyces radiatus TaxID=101107 RepID=UPI002220011D|nr:Per1-like protein [Halteromyces radiatus]KAI8093050.1 Per1-like protein [Halteromyces radiatus]